MFILVTTIGSSTPKNRSLSTILNEAREDLVDLFRDTTRFDLQTLPESSVSVEQFEVSFTIN